MRNFRKACAVALMVFTLSFTALADDGWIGTGFVQQPPPPVAPPSTEPGTDVSDPAPAPEMTPLDVAIETARTFFEGFQTLL